MATKIYTPSVEVFDAEKNSLQIHSLDDGTMIVTILHGKDYGMSRMVLSEPAIEELKKFFRMLTTKNKRR